MELGVRDVPVLVRGAFVKNLLVLYYVANLVLAIREIIIRRAYRSVAMLANYLSIFGMF